MVYLSGDKWYQSLLTIESGFMEEKITEQLLKFK